jgi:hypothetical protein
VFTGTVVYALMNGTTNYEIMTGQFAVVMTAHGARNIAGPQRRLRYSRG